jgi:stage IV sporulation protein FB
MIILSIFPSTRHGLQLNLLAVATFLLATNCFALKQKPYHFLRFLMSRDRIYSQRLLSGQLAQPIIVHRKQKVSDILRLFMREKYHLIYVMDERGSIQAVLPEQRLLHTFFIDKKPGCAVSELFL